MTTKAFLLNKFDKTMIEFDSIAINELKIGFRKIYLEIVNADIDILANRSLAIIKCLAFFKSISDVNEKKKYDAALNAFEIELQKIHNQLGISGKVDEVEIITAISSLLKKVEKETSDKCQNNLTNNLQTTVEDIVKISE